MATFVVFVLFSGVLVSSFLVEESCRGRCHKYESGRSCSCNDLCSKYHDCCKDHSEVCGTCAGQCDISYDSSRGCQCNDLCSQYGNCCNDYTKVCTRGAQSSKIADELWRIDVHQFEPDELTLNYGAHLDGPSSDQSPKPLFTKVDENRFNHPTYKTFIALFDNYNLTQGDPVTSADQSEIDAFLDAVFTSEITRTAHDFLLQNNFTTGQLSNYRTTMKNLWFTTFSRNGTSVKESSGFQSMVLGERNSAGFTAAHNWISFYMQEKAGTVNYQGYSKKTDFMLEPVVILNSQTSTTSFFIGSSPTFDINLSTICALSKQSPCQYSISGTSFSLFVTTRGSVITDAYPSP